MIIYLVKKAKTTLLFIKKVKILTKYLDFVNIFSKKKVLLLSKIAKLNQYIIEL